MTKQNLGGGLLIIAFLFMISGCDDKSISSPIVLEDNQDEKNQEQIDDQEKVISFFENSNFGKAQFHRFINLYNKLEEDQKIIDHQAFGELFVDGKATKIFFEGEIAREVSFDAGAAGFLGRDISIKNVTVKEKLDGSFELLAIIHCQNNNGGEPFQSYQWNINLVHEEARLPRFGSWTVKSLDEPVRVSENDKNLNLAMSAIHYWIGLDEELLGNVEPFKEILSPEFELSFSTGSKITTIDKMNSWLKARATLLDYSKQLLSEVDVTKDSLQRICVTMNVDWTGITMDSNKMNSKSIQKWILNPNSEFSFPLIKQIQVEEIEPFRIVN